MTQLITHRKDPKMVQSAIDVDATDVRHSKAPPSGSRIATSVVLALIAAYFLWWLVSNPRFEWDVVVRWLFTDTVLKGVGMTLLLTAVSMTLGSLLGVVLAMMRMSDFRPLQLISVGFVWFFRAVPMLVQLIFWFNLSYLVPRIIIGVPFGPDFFSWNTNDLINAFTAAVIGLIIHEAAYMAEIIRSGVLSVDSGQRDAARALGYQEKRIFMKFILPQALRVIIPPTGSQVISLLKGTSLVSVIGMTDLLYAVQNVYNRTFEIVPMLLVATVWYLVLIAIMSYFQSKIERRLSRGYRATGRTQMPKVRSRISMPGKVQ